jgi:hypothetical protein
MSMLIRDLASAPEDRGRDARHVLFMLEQSRLAELAWRAQVKGHSLRNIAVVSIHVDDDAWRGLADRLMPGTDWDALRNGPNDPVFARGSVMRQELSNLLEKQVPSLAPALRMRVPPGFVLCAVMAGGGASLYHLQPRAQAS